MKKDKGSEIFFKKQMSNNFAFERNSGTQDHFTHVPKTDILASNYRHYDSYMHHGMSATVDKVWFVL